MFHEMFQKLAYIFDTGVISAAIAAFFGWLPNATAFFALIYLLIRIWETETIRRLTNRFNEEK